MSTDEIEVTGALTERLFGAVLGALELATVHLGVRLGLYDVLATPRTAAGLAEAAGIDERYAAEWLEQQAISGLVTVTEAGNRESRVYGLDPEQSLSFGDPGSPAYAGAMALLMGGVVRVLDQLPEAYRTGSGIPFGGYGDDVRTGQGLFNRAGFLGQLTQEWLPAIAGVSDLLGRPGARALDIGCGVGWSSIALATAFPGLSVLGIDSDDASVMDARRNAAEAGLGERVRFEVADAAALPAEGGFDVVFYFEALHDLPHPVESLTAARSALTPGGVVVVADERAEEEFAPGGSEIERLLATSSVLHCLPVGRAQPDAEGTGALFRPSMMRDYASRAGYASVDEAPVPHDLLRFFVVRP